ncbi:hypothetical protein AB0H77_04975 [Streptomyces sp. NPDC050844]|uniref:hypothetical protein n=1 Tax=Streptomyces sp. NPDC050844 TaxID=3155790 RepID=UPI0033CEA934
MKREPRHVVVDGEPLVALTDHDLENLLAMRRQLGAQGVRLRSVRDALADLTDFVEELGDALAEEGRSDDLDGLLADLPERVRRARRVAGGRGAKVRNEP